MSGVTKKLMSASGGVAGFTAIEDVFSTYLYAGKSSTQTITNGIDLAGEGGLVWIKGRNLARNTNVFDTERGVNNHLFTATAAANTVENRLTSFNSNGFTLDPEIDINANTYTYASWTFRKAPRFFDVVTYTGTGAARTVIHNLGTTVGSIIIKRTDTTSNWAVYHRGNTAAPETDFLSLNLTNATADDATYWNDTAPTDSVFTVGTNAAVNASGGTYVAYLFAHDPLGPSGDGSDGLIDCGSFTTDGSGKAIVDLGWEPQWVMFKRTNSSTAGDWYIVDNMRKMTANTSNSIFTLYAQKSNVEENGSELIVSSTEFAMQNLFSGSTYIYIAIRRGPMRAPTSGTEVYLPSTATGVVTTGFPVDLHIGATQAGLSTNHRFHDRLRGGTKELVSSSTAAETTVTDLLFDGNEGLRFSFGSGQVNHFFRRAPEFFDVVAYTGNGTTTSSTQTIRHNLGVAPEMVIIKTRDNLPLLDDWLVHHEALVTTPIGGTVFGYPSTGIKLTNESFSGTTILNQAPTSSEFVVRNTNTSNKTGSKYIAYLFATLAGISKVGSYTGNGTSQTINCGFTTGARFIIIKRTDSTGDWYVWDTARGIVAANDPHLSLNTTAAEVTTNDSVDPVSSGFIVNQVAATNINVSAASYIFYAVA